MVSRVLMITTAYEQGVGKGQQAFNRSTEIENPYSDSECNEAWKLGYEEGKSQSQHIKSKWMPIETAPRYGRILVKGTEIGICVASAGWDTETPDKIRWEVVNDIVVNPTHWMYIAQ